MASLDNTDTVFGHTYLMMQRLALDRDGDGVPNMYDLDSDNDGVSDLVESGNVLAIRADTNNDGVIEGPDADGDGIMDAPDTNDSVRGSPGMAAPLMASDSVTPRMLERYSAGAMGPSDLRASGRNVATFDANNDGLLDAMTVIDNDYDGIIDTTTGGTMIDWRPGMFGGLAMIDTDGDGVPNPLDIDADNDGILNTIEGLGDKDGDGILNFLDLDSDNDGIPDLIEGLASSYFAGAGLATLDGNFDGVLDGPSFGTNGYDNRVETAADSGVPLASIFGSSTAAVDTDGDGVPDFLDLD